MKNIIKKSKEHLNMVDESYFQHMGFAISVGSKMIIGGLMAILHAFIPSLFQTSASDCIKELHNIITKKRKKK